MRSLGQEVTPTPSEAAETERVIVTGSNIPTASEVGPNPVLSISRERIDKSSERTTEELIRNLTVAGPNGVPTSNNAAGTTPGASSVSLRGFDPSDTLTLIDGRRVAPYPLGANGTQSFVDLNSIPSAAIDSIEILKDSASATYGADAVAGVVNIKLRHDYRGAESDIEYGDTLDKDSSKFSASVLFGVGDANTQVNGVLNFYHRNSIYNRDRAYSSFAPNPGSTNASPANLELSRTAVIAAGGVPSPTLGDTFFGHAPFFTNGTAPASEYAYTRGRSVMFNFNAFQESLPDSERYGGYFSAERKLCGDQLALYADVFYQNVKTHYDLAPAATQTFVFPGATTLAIPPHSPGTTLGGPSYQETNVALGAFNPFNPFQQIISGNSRGRLVDFGDRLIDDETDGFFSTIGLKGDKLFDGNWGYDAAFRYSQVKNTLERTDVSASRFNRILNAADPIFDPSSSQFIGTTIPYNPFGDFRVPVASNFLSTGFATIRSTDVNISKLATLDLTIYTTSLFNLPAGGVGLALGGQFRRENLRQEPDQLSVGGDTLGQVHSFFVHAGRKTFAFYAEANLPIFGAEFDAPGLHALEFNVAGRFEEFLSNRSNVLVPKIGVRWQPFDDSLTIRATWGEGFHQPSLIELFGTPVQAQTTVIDPRTGNVESEIPYVIRSNSNLQPEDSRAFSAGFVLSPKSVPGLVLTVDLFDIESVGRVNSSPNPQDVVDRAESGQLLPGEKVNRDAAGNITSIELAFENGGSQKARGVDLSLQYQIQTPCGTFTSLLEATYLDSFQFAALPGATEIELRGSGLPGFLSDEGYLKWKSNMRLDWEWYGFDAGVIAHYLDGFHETPISGREHYVKQTWIFDVRASYNFNVSPDEDGEMGKSTAKATIQNASYASPAWRKLLNGVTVTLGCNNVFGQDPPDAFNTATNYADFTYDPTGRFVYIRLTKVF